MNRCFDRFAPSMGVEQSRAVAAHQPCGKAKGSSDDGGDDEISAPCPSTMTSKRDRRRLATMFPKRRRTLVERAHSLWKDCDARVYLAIEKDGHFYSFESVTDSTWRDIKTVRRSIDLGECTNGQIPD